MKIIELPNFTLVHDYDASMIIGDSLSLLQNSWKGGQTDRKASGGDFLPPQLTFKGMSREMLLSSHSIMIFIPSMEIVTGSNGVPFKLPICT